MESNRSYYSRRALQESMKAARAVTPQAQAWHRQLAEGFSVKAQELTRAIEAA
jgi:predicted transcriptional regulator